MRRTPAIRRFPVTRVWFYDLTGLLCIPRKVKGAASFCALPQIETARVRSVLPQEAEDSGEADPNRPGHSRPELFGVHEYVPGDPLRDIHWKLSARLDKMMVREYVRPVSRDIGLLLLNGGSGISPAAADKLADAAFSLSLSLVQADVRHTLCWCENGQAKTAPVQSEEDVFAAARAMLSVPLCPSDMLLQLSAQCAAACRASGYFRRLRGGVCYPLAASQRVRPSHSSLETMCRRFLQSASLYARQAPSIRRSLPPLLPHFCLTRGCTHEKEKTCWAPFKQTALPLRVFVCIRTAAISSCPCCANMRRSAVLYSAYCFCFAP